MQNTVNLVKIQHQKEIHIFKETPLKLENIQNFVKKYFRNVPSNYTLTYKDSENDEITVSCEQDLEILLEDFQSLKKTPKLLVQTPENINNSQESEKNIFNPLKIDLQNIGSLFFKNFEENSEKFQNPFQSAFEKLSQDIPQTSQDNLENIIKQGLQMFCPQYQQNTENPQETQQTQEKPENINISENQQQTEEKENQQLPPQEQDGDYDEQTQQILETYYLQKVADEEKTSRKDSDSFQIEKEEIVEKTEKTEIKYDILDICQKAKEISLILGGDSAQYINVVKAYHQRDLDYILNRLVIDPSLVQKFSEQKKENQQKEQQLLEEQSDEEDLYC